MLITKIKDEKSLISELVHSKVFVLKCFGCKEVFFPEKEIDLFIDRIREKVSRQSRVDYVCNEDFAVAYAEHFKKDIEESDIVLVFSCGVGVQVVSGVLEKKKVLPGCDTFYINGFQGLCAQDNDCEQCGECFLNMTGCICPLTSCAKGLLNGPCGGADEEGKCEVSKAVNCGWVKIYEKTGSLMDKNRNPSLKTYIRDYRIITDST